MMRFIDDDTNNDSRKTNRKVIVIVAILLITTCLFGLTSMALAVRLNKANKATLIKEVSQKTSAVTENKVTPKDKKQIKAMQEAFPKVRIGMDESEMLKVVGMDFQSKAKQKVADSVECTQYDFLTSGKTYGFSVLVNGGKVVGKGQTALFAPNKKVESADIQTCGESVTYEDMVKKCGKGVVVSCSEIPGLDSQRVVLYGSKDSTLWIATFSKDTCMSVNQISSDSSTYLIREKTEKVGEVE